MKKNDYAILPSALLFSALFYQQQPGMNFLIFTLLLSALTIYFDPHRAREPRWWFFFSCMNVTSLAVFVINSDLSVMACVASVLVFSSKCLAPHSSTAVNGFFGLYSLVRSPLDIALTAQGYFTSADASKSGHNKKIILGIVAAIAAALVFLGLYMAANPLFAAIFRHISFEWLDNDVIPFTVFGLLVMHSLLRSQKIIPILQFDARARQDIAAGEAQPHEQLKGNTVIAIGLFSLLNLMLLLMNGLDIVNIYLTRQLPEGITLSDFVHEAVAGMMVSIILGVLLLTWFFNGELNFSRYGRPVRSLGYLWIIQNTLVVINTLVRNYRYVEGFHLTGMRIAVFVFLALTVCGLYLTYIKISQLKSAWWLITCNLHLWFLTLLCCSLFNWGRIITGYNVTHATEGKPLDKKYLLQLGDANLPQLVDLHNNGMLTPGEDLLLYHKLLRTYEKNRPFTWQSFNLRQKANNGALRELEP